MNKEEEAIQEIPRRQNELGWWSVVGEEGRNGKDDKLTSLVVVIVLHMSLAITGGEEIISL